MQRGMLAIACLTVVVVFGCSRGGTGGPATVKTRARVLLNGQPVADANVTLAPEGSGRAAFGKTDSQGWAPLATTNAIEGLLPGSYQVTVIKQRTEGGMTSEESQAYFEKNGKGPPPPNVIDELPTKYASPATSELKATVNTSGPSELIFELKK